MKNLGIFVGDFVSEDSVVLYLKILLSKRNTQGTAGGLGGHDRTLAVKSRKIAKKSALFRKKIKTT